MNPESQAALAQLERELERLRSAVEHIDQAKSVAQRAVGAVATIQQKYAEHLDALLDVQKEAVREAGSVQQARFDELGAAARRHILESAARAKKYLEEYNAEVHQSIATAGESAGETVLDLSVKAGGVIENTAAQLQQRLQHLLGGVEQRLAEVHTRVVGLVEESGGSAVRHIDEVAGKSAAAIETLDARARAHMEEIGTLAKQSLRDVMLQAKETFEDAGNQSKKIYAAIKKSQDQQSIEFEKVTVSADALIAASGKLVRTIDSIDFPARIQSIEGDIRSLHYNLNTAMSRLDALGKSNEQAMALFGEDVTAKLGRMEMFTEKAVRTHGDEVEKRFKEQEAQIGSLRILLVVVLLLNLLVAVGTYLIWSGGDDAMPPTPVEQLAADSTAEAAAPPADEKPGTRKK